MALRRRGGSVAGPDIWPGFVDALASLLAKLSVAIARAPWCAELDLNPVMASGNRFVIVDARLRVQSPRD